VRHFKAAEMQQFNIHAHKAGRRQWGLLIVLATVGSALVLLRPGQQLRLADDPDDAGRGSDRLCRTIT